MKKRLPIALALVAIFAGVVVSIYLYLRRGEAGVGSAADPVVVVLSPDHARNLPDAGRARLAALLKEASGLEVSLEVASTPVDAVERFRKRADVGLLSLFEYVLAREEYGVVAALRVLRDGGRDAYTGDIAVRPESPAKTLADLAGKRVAFVNPYSTSGTIFPSRMLRAAGVKVLAEELGTHAAVLDALRSGKADAAATYSTAARAAGLRTLATTASIPNEPIFFRKNLLPEKREKLVAAFTKVAASAEGKAVFAKVAAIDGVRPAGDADYADVLAAIRGAGKSVYDVVRDGKELVSQRRRVDLAP